MDIMNFEISLDITHKDIKNDSEPNSLFYYMINEIFSFIPI